MKYLKKNKYEDIQMVDLEDKVDDIISIYINRLYHTDKTVGVIVNKEIAEYVLDNLIRLDETSIKEIDLVDYMNIDEYLVSVDDGGVITVVPIEDFCVLDKTDIFYIDMDGDISQDIIDYCVNEDKEVILFGQEDDCDDGCENSEEEGFTVNGKPVSKEEFDNYTSQFKHDEKPTTTTASKESYFINGKSVDKSEFDKKYEEFEEMYMDNISNIMLDYCNLMDNVNDWRNRILSW